MPKLADHPSDTPARRVVLTELGAVTADIEKAQKELARLYRERTGLIKKARKKVTGKPDVPFSRIATVCKVVEAAVIAAMNK